MSDIAGEFFEVRYVVLDALVKSTGALDEDKEWPEYELKQMLKSISPTLYEAYQTWLKAFERYINVAKAYEEGGKKDKGLESKMLKLKAEAEELKNNLPQE